MESQKYYESDDESDSTNPPEETVSLEVDSAVNTIKKAPELMSDGIL